MRRSAEDQRGTERSGSVRPSASCLRALTPGLSTYVGRVEDMQVRLARSEPMTMEDGGNRVGGADAGREGLWRRRCRLAGRGQERPVEVGL